MASGVEPDAFFCYNNRDSLYTNERRKSYECKNIKAAGDHPGNLSCGGIHRVAAADRIPSSVMAILILALLLFTKILKEEHIRETGDFLLSNMALVFVPISIGMVEDFGLLKGQLAGFLIVVCISLVMTFLGTYASVRIVQMCMKRLAGKGGQADE